MYIYMRMHICVNMKSLIVEESVDTHTYIQIYTYMHIKKIVLYAWTDKFKYASI